MKWWNVDLPNLTSIDNFEGNSFCCPRSVTLESISDYWILIVFRYSKTSKCQATLFILSCSIEINFEYCLIDLISFIDVSSILANRVKIKHYIYDWELFSNWSLIRNISIDWVFVCFKPILDPNSWFYYYQNINPFCLIMMYSLPLLQWHWIRIVVSIDQPFISIIINVIVITNDPTITYWTFTNDNDSNLPIITKW